MSKPDQDELSDIVLEVFLMIEFWLVCIIPSILLGIFNTWMLWDANKLLALIVGQVVCVVAIIAGVFGVYVVYAEALSRDRRNKEKFIVQWYLHSERFRNYIVDWLNKEIE